MGNLSVTYRSNVPSASTIQWMNCAHNGIFPHVKHGAIFNAHRIILAARIPSLRAALSGALGKDNSVLKWPTVPLNLANSLLQYVYTGQLEVTQTNAMAIVMFAKMMRLSDLENWGVRFMANRVNLENLATTWDFARSSNMGSLMETCINLMQEQFRSFVSSDLFVRLPADTVLTLLRNDDLSNRPVRRTALVARELARYKVDIAALSETRFSEQGQLEVVRAGYTFFWSGRPRAERRDAGVVLAIRNDIVGRLPSLPQGINDRLMSLRLPLRGDWFDDNDAAIRNLLAEKNRLHKAYVDHPTDDNKVAFSRRRRQLQQRLREMQDTWTARKSDEIQGYVDRNELKNFFSAIKAVYGPPTMGTAPLLSADDSTLLTE
nr:unnamed protein product [Spirometra erinaceieuropaei]